MGRFRRVLTGGSNDFELDGTVRLRSIVANERALRSTISARAGAGRRGGRRHDSD